MLYIILAFLILYIIAKIIERKRKEEKERKSE